MKNHLGAYIFLLLLLFIPKSVAGQHIFSEKSFAYSKSFLPYDLSYTIPLEDKEFVMLSEVKNNIMMLGRYDQFFFERWEKEIEFDRDESVPQMFIKGDSVVCWSFTTYMEDNSVQISFRYFSLEDGTEYTPTDYVIEMIAKQDLLPRISFSESRSKFTVYNFLTNQDNAEKVEFQIFELGNTDPVKTFYLGPEYMQPSKSRNVHVSNDGDLFLVLIDPGEFKTETFFWSFHGNGPNQVTNNFFFERPVETIGEIEIVRQGQSSYFVSFTGRIEDELIGFGVVGVNVILKTVMYAYNQNLRKDEIDVLYQDSYYTTQNQKKKRLEIPEILENYRLVNSFTNSANDVVLVMEELELPVHYFKNSVSGNMPWKFKSNEDKFYFGGDIFLYCFTENGELKWKKAIQKTQFSQANALGLSFIPKMSGDNLRLLMYESSKGGNFYILDINTIAGSLEKTTNLLPDDRFEFAKRYSCWLNDHAVVICGIAPANINRRNLMLVEF